MNQFVSSPHRRRRDSQRTLNLLRRFESPNVTFIEPDGSWPVIWERARGVHVWDANGRRYVDLTAAFGVAAAGHANPRVIRRGQLQLAKLVHAMGDVHPHSLKAELARELSRMTFERWFKRFAQTRKPAVPTGKTIFCNSGFEAVEAALKTAILATDRPGIIAFEHGYHGLGHGALNLTHRNHFRGPFRPQLREFGHFVPYPGADTDHSSSGRRIRTRDSLDSVQRQIEHLLATKRIGAIIAEPVQARGGINVPSPQFLPMLRRLCDRHRVLLVLDEIYTGFGRTGKWFACEHTATIPDIVCLGKALTGGFPLSAMVGRADIMDTAWPKSRGEAIHTSTFLGNPVGCAMALAQIREIQRLRLPERSARLGGFLLDALNGIASRPSRLRLRARGIGLMAGLEMRNKDGSPATQLTFEIIKRLLHRGFILLPEGEHGNVISFTPPLTIRHEHLSRSVAALRSEFQSIAI